MCQRCLGGVSTNDYLHIYKAARNGLLTGLASILSAGKASLERKQCHDSATNALGRDLTRPAGGYSLHRQNRHREPRGQFHLSVGDGTRSHDPSRTRSA